LSAALSSSPHQLAPSSTHSAAVSPSHGDRPPSAPPSKVILCRVIRNEARLPLPLESLAAAALRPWLASVAATVSQSPTPPGLSRDPTALRVLQKIVIFSRTGAPFQAFVQFADVASATEALAALDGSEVWPSSGVVLSAAFAKLSQLDVASPSERRRDFTTTAAPAPAPVDGADPPAKVYDHGPAALTSALNAAAAIARSVSTVLAERGVPGRSPRSVSGSWTASSPSRPVNTPPRLDDTRLHPASPSRAGHGFGRSPADSQSYLGEPFSSSPAGSDFGGFPSSLDSDRGRHFGTPDRGGGAFGGAGSVLIVSGFDPTNTTCDDLFNLFGVYGDVARVRKLFNKPGAALVQYMSGMGASTCLRLVTGTGGRDMVLRGARLRVSRSRHDAVAPVSVRDSESGSAADYRRSSLHRFGGARHRHATNVAPPSPALHLSSIPEDVSDSDITDLFARFGQIIAFRRFSERPDMATLVFGSTDQAVTALVSLHNTVGLTGERPDESDDEQGGDDEDELADLLDEEGGDATGDARGQRVSRLRLTFAKSLPREVSLGPGGLTATRNILIA